MASPSKDEASQQEAGYETPIEETECTSQVEKQSDEEVDEDLNAAAETRKQDDFVESDNALKEGNT